MIEMASVNSNQGSTPTTPELKSQSASKNSVAQRETSGTLPKTPPNTRTISPPRAPRPRRTLRTEGMWTRNRELSTQTPSRILTNTGTRFVTPARHYQSNRDRDSRSVSPLESQPRSYRARSSLLHHPRNRPFAGAAPRLLPSVFIDEGAISSNNHTFGRFEEGMQYMNMLSVPDLHPKEETAAGLSSGLQDDEYVKSNLTEDSFNEYDNNDEENENSDEKNEKEHDIWSWKC